MDTTYDKNCQHYFYMLEMKQSVVVKAIFIDRELGHGVLVGAII